MDPHSWWRAGMPRTTSLDWDVLVDFTAQRLDCVALLGFDHDRGGEVTLDTRALDVREVTVDGRPVPYRTGAHDPVLGEPLTFELPEGCDEVRIVYRTTAASTALQWLAPAQTLGGTHHFLYCQCQTIHARSMVPLHDSMAAKITVRARVTVPDDYTVLMAATSVGDEDAGADHRTYRFDAPEPRSPYLLALVVGALACEDLSSRSSIWAEPEILEDAAYEFGEVETLLRAAENLYGPYPWERLDLVVMPPSYPYGGLENPGLIYLTPTSIVGDRSEVGLLSHEIAHHWSGDLVTAASMNDFWVNEGLTTYGERRITEATEGRDVAELHTALAIEALRTDFAYLADSPELTHLRMDLTGQDPDTTSSWVAHEKGGLFVRALEEAVGRERFDPFFQGFFRDFAWESLTSDEFVAYARERLGDALDYAAWLDGPWLPEGCPGGDSRLLAEVEAVGQAVPGDAAAAWTTGQWKAYLTRLEPPVQLEVLAEIDSRYGFTGAANLELRVPWLVAALRSGYEPALASTDDVLGRVGRMKFLKPLYEALLATPETTAEARSMYERHRAGYHPIARAVVESHLARATDPS